MLHEANYKKAFLCKLSQSAVSIVDEIHHLFSVPALRFALLEMKVCISKIVSLYSIGLDSKTKEPFTFDQNSFFPRPVGGMWINFKKRSKQWDWGNWLYSSKNNANLSRENFQQLNLYPPEGSLMLSARYSCLSKVISPKLTLALLFLLYASFYTCIAGKSVLFISYLFILIIINLLFINYLFLRLVYNSKREYFQ